MAQQWAVTVCSHRPATRASSSKGDEITGLGRLDSLDVEFHAGTAQRGDAVVTAGGRVLNVTGLGDSPSEARERPTGGGADRVPGASSATDIAARAVERTEVNA